MDCTFTYQATEKGTKKAIKTAYDIMANYWHWLVGAVVLAIMIDVAFLTRGPHAMSDYFVMGFYSASPFAFWFARFRYVRAIVRFLRKNKAFDCPTEAHLTDEFMEVSLEGNVSRTKWKDGITHYLVLGNMVIFFSNRLIVGGLPIRDNAFRLDELLSVLDMNGIRPYRRSAFRKYGRWVCYVVLSLALVAAVVLRERSSDGACDGFVCTPEGASEVAVPCTWRPFDDSSVTLLRYQEFSFGSPEDCLTVDFADRRISYAVLHDDARQKPILVAERRYDSDDDWAKNVLSLICRANIETWREAGLENWEGCYREGDVCDGTQWTLEVFAGTNLVHSYVGDNAAPDGLEDVISIRKVLAKEISEAMSGCSWMELMRYIRSEK